MEYLENELWILAAGFVEHNDLILILWQFAIASSGVL
jgi:hypothetical protein